MLGICTLINFLGICMETSKSNKAGSANPFNIAMMHAKMKTWSVFSGIFWKDEVLFFFSDILKRKKCIWVIQSKVGFVVGCDIEWLISKRISMLWDCEGFVLCYGMVGSLSNYLKKKKTRNVEYNIKYIRVKVVRMVQSNQIMAPWLRCWP